jgi:uncharacterized protein (DUF305 family)
MQINIDKKTGVLLGIILSLIAVIVGMLIYSGRNDHMRNGIMHGDRSDFGIMQSGSDLTGADIMFLQMMIPHHQQAVDISNLALKTSKDSELLALAQNIRDGQSAEIITMKAWLTGAGSGLDMGHTMPGMGGMLSQDEVSKLSAASGKDFNLLWLNGMIAHHDGAIHMTTMIRDANNPAIKAFGEAIVKDQSAQIEQMKKMLLRLS